MRENYRIMRIKLDGEDRYILWFSDTRDGVYTSSDEGGIPEFTDTGSLENFCNRQRIALTPGEPIYCNLDMIRGWLESPTEHGIKYDEFFHVWNVIHDILLSVDQVSVLEEEFHDYYALYDKLFWGAMMESREGIHSRYYQEWNEDEIASLQGIFKKGIDYFRQYGSLYTRT